MRTHFVFVLLGCGLAFAQSSPWASIGPNGTLVYQQLPAGDRIMDFSSAGYMGGGVPLPDGVVPVVMALDPSGGDDTAAIQAAIDTVSAMPLVNGFKGAIQLDSGSFYISSSLNIASSGVVITGSGSTQGGTVIVMADTGTGTGFTAFNVSGSGSYKTGKAINLTDSYVPSGTNTFKVADASGFKVGDTVLITRVATAEWIHYMGMDTLVRDGVPQTWIPVGHKITTDRIIQAIEGDTITLDAPLTDSFDATYLGSPVGTIAKYTYAGRISEVGIEHLSVLAPMGSVPYTAVAMDKLIDGWILDVVGQETLDAFDIQQYAKRVTVEAVINNVSTVQTVVAAPFAFEAVGTQILFDNCQANSQGIWPFMTGSTATGPAVLLNFRSTETYPVEPHQRWYTGLLTDGASLNAGVDYVNRRTDGTGHGWASGWSVVWNSTGNKFIVSAAPGTESWCIGCLGEQASNSPDPDGIFDSQGVLVQPSSLYLEQLCERLGPDAAANIGYPGVCLQWPLQ